MTMPSFSRGIEANETRLHHCNAPFGALRLSEESLRMTMPSFSRGIVANETRLHHCNLMRLNEESSKQSRCHHFLVASWTRLHHCNAPFGALRLSEESLRMTMPSFSRGIVANETRLHHCNAPFGALRLSEESSLPNTLCVFKSSFFKSSFFNLQV